MPKIQTDLDCYRIVSDTGVEGEPVEYGCQASLDTDDEHLTALVDLNDKDEPVTKLIGGAWVMDAVTLEKFQDVELEEVEFDEDDGDEDDEENEDEDDPDELEIGIPDEDEEDEADSVEEESETK